MGIKIKKWTKYKQKSFLVLLQRNTMYSASMTDYSVFINREIVKKKNESDTVILLLSSKSGNLLLHLFDE